MAALLAGCSRPDGELAPVQGQVFYRGRPLPGGTIVFTPDPERGGSGPLAVAAIQPDGRYALTTEGRAGAVPGWHRVTVVAVEDGSFTSGPRPLLPSKYSDPGLSELSCQVESGKENGIDLRLQ